MINDVKRVKDFNIQYVSGIWGDYSSEENDDGIFVLRSTEQKLNGELNIINPAYIKADYKSKNILREGDLLITKSSGSKSHVGKCSYISKEVASCKYAFSNFMIGIRVKDRKLTPEYLYFCINSKLIKRQIERNSMNVTLNNLNQNNISNWFIPFFSIDIQKNIVNFLKNEIKIIDKKLKKYNKKIELLKEYKEALIYETVTKGLDKKSNILWKAKRLKDIIYLNKGKAVETVLEQINGYLPLIDTNYLRNRKDNIVYSKNGLYVKKNEVLVLWDGANSGEMFYNTNNGFLGSTFGVMKLKSKVNNSKFLFYYLKAFEKDIRKDIVGMGIPHVNGTKLKQRLIYIPPNNEQNEIVNFLDKKTKEIDSEVKKLYKKIELIKELKESIIYECVTGKLDIEKEGEKYQKIIESI